eukprot:scaffold19009_cov98-Isochrysis_galbana.AAC.4
MGPTWNVEWKGDGGRPRMGGCVCVGVVDGWTSPTVPTHAYPPISSPPGGRSQPIAQADPDSAGVLAHASILGLTPTSSPTGGNASQSHRCQNTPSTHPGGGDAPQSRQCGRPRSSPGPCGT